MLDKIIIVLTWIGILIYWLNLKKEYAYDPYLGDGPEGEYFWDEWAVVRLLKDDILFVNSRKYLDSSGENPETLVLFVNCNDVFCWGAADAEQLPLSEVRRLYEMHVADSKWGYVKWCCLRRNLRPQVPIVREMKETGVWTDDLEALPEPQPS